MALTGNPALIVLDEAFNGLDPASALILKNDLHERVANRRCAVLLATHALDIVMRHSTRAALLLEGRLCKIWDSDQLEDMRNVDPGAFESALADAAQGSVA